MPWVTAILEKKTMQNFKRKLLRFEASTIYRGKFDPTLTKIKAFFYVSVHKKSVTFHLHENFTDCHFLDGFFGLILFYSKFSKDFTL